MAYVGDGDDRVSKWYSEMWFDGGCRVDKGLKMEEGLGQETTESWWRWVQNIVVGERMSLLWGGWRQEGPFVNKIEVWRQDQPTEFIVKVKPLFIRGEFGGELLNVTKEGFSLQVRASGMLNANARAATKSRLIFNSWESLEVIGFEILSWRKANILITSCRKDLLFEGIVLGYDVCCWRMKEGWGRSFK